MPTISVRPTELYEQLGTTLNTEQFTDLCFNFGVEFDGEDHDDDGHLTYRIEVPANRYDLLCVEGIATALAVFTQRIPSPPMYTLEPLSPSVKMMVKASTALIRPYGFAAILRGVQFTEARYKSFIDLQDKLHQNLARKRSLVAIGTHDLSTLNGPFIYSADAPQDIRFTPLYHSNEVDGIGLMESLSSHAQLKYYLHLIRESPVYPVIRDVNGVVLSVPPIINGEHSKVKIETKDVFIEVTAKDRTKGGIVLNTVVALFSKHCQIPFKIEPVMVQYESDHPILGGKLFVNPILKEQTFTVDMNYARTLIGTPNMTSKIVCDLLQRMMIPSEIDPTDSEKVICHVPVTRSDVLHACDLVEDIAIAYGYNNVAPTEFSSASEQPYMALSNQIRSELANCGYHEALNWGLCSVKEGFDFFQRKWRESPDSPLKTFEYDTLNHPVKLSNPKTREFEIVRTSLLPGLLKTLSANKAQELPLKLFELGDVVCIDHSTETKARTSRYCAALIANNTGAGLEHIHGLLDVLLGKLSLLPEYHEMQSGSAGGLDAYLKTGERIYKLVPTEDDQAFLPGRSVKIVVVPDNVQIGLMGVLHPNVLKSFNVSLPCSVFELSLQPFLKWLPESRLYDE